VDVADHDRGERCRHAWRELRRWLDDVPVPGVQRSDAAIAAVAGSTMMCANIVVDREEKCQLMVEVGDRIRLSSMKGPSREGLVTAVTGSLLRVRWLSGEETLVAPAPGTPQRALGGQGRPSEGRQEERDQEHGRRDEEEHRQQKRAAQEKRAKTKES